MPNKLVDITNYPEEATTRILKFLGLDPSDPEYVDTPRRVRQWFAEFCVDPDLDLHLKDVLSKTFLSSHEELVFESNLSFVSLCPHHLLPYSGTASIGYIPSGRVVGISKLARALDLVTHCPIKQEDATAFLADSIMEHLKPLGCMIILKAFHTCMGLRGVRQPNHSTGTSAVRGCFSSDTDGCRTEFLRLITSPIR